jgi:hypothetical protein
MCVRYVCQGIFIYRTYGLETSRPVWTACTVPALRYTVVSVYGILASRSLVIGPEVQQHR